MDTEEGNENEKKIISKTDWSKAHCSAAFSQHPLELIEDIDMKGLLDAPFLFYTHIIPSLSTGYNFPWNEEENVSHLESLRQCIYRW